MSEDNKSEQDKNQAEKTTSQDSSVNNEIVNQADLNVSDVNQSGAKKSDTSASDIRESEVSTTADVSSSDSNGATNHTAERVKPQSGESNSATAPLFNAKPMPKMNAKKSKKSGFMISLIGLLVVIALLVSSYSIYQQSLIQANLAEFKSTIKQQVNSQTQAIDAAKNSGASSLQASQQVQQQLTQLAQSNQQLADSLLSTQEKIKAVSGRKKQDWMLAEAAYLIKVAQLQLTLQKDKNTAMQLLKTADARIVEIADNSLLPIRQAIAKDLSNLSLIMAPDLTGMTFSLDAVIQQIPILTLKALEFQQVEQAIPDPSVEEDSFSFDGIYEKFLNDFVVIREHSDERKPLMAPDQRVNLDRNIQLAIQQAQIALAQGNESLYRLNLTNAIRWITEFFSKNDQSDKLIGQLNQLNQLAVETHYPNQLNAKRALDEISRQQLYRWLDTAPVNSLPIESNDKLPDVIESNSNDSSSEPQGENP